MCPSGMKNGISRRSMFPKDIYSRYRGSNFNTPPFVLEGNKSQHEK